MHHSVTVMIAVLATALPAGLPAGAAGATASSDPTGICTVPVGSSVPADTTTVDSTVPVTAVEPAAWQTIEIVDVCGGSFTLASLAGRPVFVENFATWCHNCLSQLGDTQEAAAELGDEAVFVALSVETDIARDDVAAYADDNGFVDIRFAVMSPELLAAMVESFGNSAANPPSTPHLIIAADGTPSELATGAENADDIVEAVRSVA